MSVEISVLSDTQLNSIAEWQRAIDAEEFPLRLTDDAPLDAHGGSLVAHLRESETRIEYRIEEFGRTKEFYEKVNFGRDWKCLLVIPWIHGFDGLTAAWMAATAYARATSGVIFDPQEGEVFNLEEALKVIQGMERTRPEAEAALRAFMRGRSAKSNQT
jgi:hypothetical protein